MRKGGYLRPRLHDPRGARHLRETLPFPMAPLPDVKKNLCLAHTGLHTCS